MLKMLFWREFGKCFLLGEDANREGVGIGKSYFQQSVVFPRQSQLQRIWKSGAVRSRYHLVCFFIHSFKYSTNIYWALFMYQDLYKAKVGRYSHSLLHRYTKGFNLSRHISTSLLLDEQSMSIFSLKKAILWLEILLE